MGISHCKGGLRSATRSAMGITALLACLLLLAAVSLATVQSDVCPTITDRLEHESLIGAGQDPVVGGELSLLIRCGSDTERSQLWTSEEARIRSMAQRTRQRQEAVSSGTATGQTQDERDEELVQLNQQHEQELALADLLRQTSQCETFSKSYKSFLEDYCSSAFGWAEHTVLACVLLLVSLCSASCCWSTGAYFQEGEDGEDLAILAEKQFLTARLVSGGENSGFQI